MKRYRLLLVPGLYNSGPAHWQSWWERLDPACSRVLQAEWDTPDRFEWVRALIARIESHDDPVVLVAHSLGCCLVAHAASHAPANLAGALMVAPSDVESPDYPSCTTNFSPMPTRKLPFPSTVVVSRDDPFVSVERAKAFASGWGSRFLLSAESGHLGSDSDLGIWEEGRSALRDLLLESGLA